jgi:hypothetical protein
MPRPYELSTIVTRAVVGELDDDPGAEAPRRNLQALGPERIAEGVLEPLRLLR